MNNAISQAQYTLKQKPIYFLASKLHLFCFLVCILCFGFSNNFLITYPIASIVFYRFAFKKTKLDNPYNAFLCQKWSDLIEKIRGKK